MKKQGKAKQGNYSQEFRETAVQLAVAGDKSVAAVAKELGIPDWKLYGWVSAWKKQHGKSGEKPGSAVDEIAKLKKELRQLKEENEILKKAAAYFAKTLQ
jgi:transposase